MNRVIIMRGHSGSGKSTYVAKHFPGAYIVSADNFWLDEKGNYNFDANRLSEAHNWALRNFLAALDSFKDYNTDNVIVVDNTNTSAVEFAPYYRVAQALGWDVEIITLDKTNVSPTVGAERNVHRVPVEAVERQAKGLRFGTSQIPKYWKHTIITEDE